MPMLTIRTNVAVAPEGRHELLAHASREVARMLGKPERYVMVALAAESPMLFGGSDAPLAYLELKSIGLPGERTTELSAALCALIGERLQVPPERVYIEFSDAARHLWGWDGGTF